jgi:hypothetical protein
MRSIQVWAELSDEMYHAYEGEAARQGVPIESLIQHTVNCLLHELEQEEKEGTDYITPS